MSAQPSPTVVAKRPTVIPTTRPAPPTWIGFGVVLGAAALFGTLGPLSRFAYEAGMEPAAFVAWRALIGLAATVAFVIWRVRRAGIRLVRPNELSRRAKTTLLVAACMGLTLNLAMFFAFDRITVALALLGFYTFPAMVAGVNVVLGRERLDGPRVVALGLALLGMVAVVASQLDPAAGIRFDVIGVALALGAAVSQTIYVVISRDGYRAVPTEQAMTVVMLVTLVGAVGLAVLSGAAGTIVYPLTTPSVLPLLLFTGIFAAAIPSLGFLTGIRTIGGTRAGILMLFEPVVGVALAAWLLDESLAPLQFVGAAAILVAAVILQRAARPDPAAPERSAPIVVPGGP